MTYQTFGLGQAGKGKKGVSVEMSAVYPSQPLAVPRSTSEADYETELKRLEAQEKALAQQEVLTQKQAAVQAKQLEMKMAPYKNLLKSGAEMWQTFKGKPKGEVLPSWIPSAVREKVEGVREEGGLTAILIPLSVTLISIAAVVALFRGRR